MSELLERPLTNLIDEVLESIEAPDAALIAEAVLRLLDPDEECPESLHLYAVQGIASNVRYHMSNRRRGLSGPTQSARWAESARQNETGELDAARLVAGISIFTGAATKWLPECSAEDLEDGKEDCAKQANSLLRNGENYGRLAKMIRSKRGASTVADLAPEKVLEVLHA